MAQAVINGANAPVTKIQRKARREREWERQREM